jgi:hypothetical protein
MTTKHRFATYKDLDEIDIFAYEAGEFCNGPKCLDCGAAKCHHCNPDFYEEECSGAG